MLECLSLVCGILLDGGEGASAHAVPGGRAQMVHVQIARHSILGSDLQENHDGMRQVEVYELNVHLLFSLLHQPVWCYRLDEKW